MNDQHGAADRRPSAAMRLLVASSRLSATWNGTDAIREALAAGVDWPALLRAARDEAVAPLLAKKLAAFSADIPAAVLEDLQRLYLRVLHRNLSLLGRLAPLLKRIRAAGLRTAVTKGARLAEGLYGDAGLRPFVDVDLVVHPADWPALAGLLAEFGFEPPDSAEAIPDPTSGRLRWLYSPVFRRGGLNLEMHFGALGLYAPLADEAGFWDAMGRQAIGGAEAMVLSPEQELAYLCLHALQHSFERLIWLTDVAELSASGQVRWDRLLALCGREKIGVPVGHGLGLAESLWPGTVPAPVLTALVRPGTAAGLCRLLWPGDRIRARTAVPVLPYYASTMFVLWGRRDPWLAARALGAILFPPRAWVSASYGIPRGSPRLAGHYLWRLFWPAGVLARRFLGGGP